MTEKQINEYENLSKLKEAYEVFIERYSSLWHGFVHDTIKDDEFKEMVKTLAKERLEKINKQIEEL